MEPPFSHLTRSSSPCVSKGTENLTEVLNNHGRSDVWNLCNCSVLTGQMKRTHAMNPTSQAPAINPLRPVVVTVVAAKLAVAALLITTVNLGPIQPTMEIAQLR